MNKKIIALILCFATFFVVSTSCFADEFVSENSLGTVYDNTSSGWIQWLCEFFTGEGDVCDKSPDNHHHASSSIRKDADGNYVCVCSYCSDSFTTSLAQIKEAEAAAVSELPVPSYSFSGGASWRPRWSDASPAIDFVNCWTTGAKGAFEVSSFSAGSEYKDPNNSAVVYHVGSSNFFGEGSSQSSLLISSLSFRAVTFTVPVTGLYTVDPHADGLTYYIRSGDSVYSDSKPFTFEPVFLQEGTSLTLKFPSYSYKKSCSYIFASFDLPYFSVDVDNPSDVAGYYADSTRIGNYTGSYAVYNSTDNSYRPVTTDKSIVNEVNHWVWNPVTNTTTDYSDWTYDYSTRTYEFHNDDNSKSCVVSYGDDAVSIADTTIDGNGNTVTNDYTVYYYNTPASDMPSPSPSPSPSPVPSAGPVGPSMPGSPSGGSRVFQNYPATITQSYGNDGHGGTDCVPTSGVPDTVVAHSDGQVVWVQTGQENNQGSTGNASYGNAVKLQHSNGYYTLYAHLDSVAVTEGQQVTKGQALGVMGNTGNSYGAHLHFEVHDSSDSRVNSDPYLYSDLPGLSSDSSWWGNAMGTLGNVLGANGLLEVFGSVGSAFSQLWSWLPPEIVSVFIVGVTLLVAAAVMKFFL